MTHCASWLGTFLVPSFTTLGQTYIVTFHPGVGPRCECVAFAANLARTGERWCKHIVHVMTRACLWSISYSGGSGELQPQVMPTRGRSSHMCPKCAGPTFKVRNAARIAMRHSTAR